MTKDMLIETLGDLGAGERCGLNYEFFENLFPPGMPDDEAQYACYIFAKENGCVIDHQASERTIWFVKQP